MLMKIEQIADERLSFRFIFRIMQLYALSSLPPDSSSKVDLA